MRLIDADELKEKIRTALGIMNFDYLLPSEKAIIDQIEKTPTVCIPQDTPLRCRTCSFFVDTDGGLCMKNGLGRCSMFGGECSADDYCSRGAWISNAVD